MTGIRFWTATASALALATTANAQSANAPTNSPPSGAQADAENADDIVVTGIRQSLRLSLDAKRGSDVIADVLSAEDIGKFPDKNVAEALQRVPGIVINREFGEGERVSLRGTAPNLTKTLVNGHTIATADWFILDQVASTRSFNYLTLPAEIVGSLEVYKSPQADVEEGGVGGTINVLTRNPLDLDPLTVSASIQGVYSDLRGKIDPQASGLVSWKNADETFGVLVGGIYQKRRTRRDGIEIFGYRAFPVAGASALVPTLIGSTMFQQERERIGGNVGIQFRPSDQIEVNLTGLYSRFGADNFNQNYIAWAEQAIAGGGTITNATVKNGVAVSGNVASSAGGTTGFGVVYDGIDRQAAAKTRSVDLDLKFTPGAATTVHFKGGWTKADGDTSNENFLEFAGPGAFSYNLDARAPEVTFSTPNPLNPAGVRPDFARIQSVTNDDEEKYLYLDVEHKFDLGPVRAIKAGVKFTDHDRAADRFATNGGVFTPGLRCGAAACVSADFATGGGMPSDFLDNIAAPGTLTDYFRIDPAKLRQIYGAQSTATTAAQFLVPGNVYSINEKTYGGYAMAKLGGDGWRGNVGVRVVRTDQTSSGFIIGGPAPAQTNPFGGFTPTTAERSYTDVLPSANLALDVTDKVVLRFAAGKTVTRPDFVDITPGVDLNGTLLTGRGGDPDLDPYRANQYDISLEWYPDRDTIVALALFYKDIQSYIVNRTATETLPGVFVPGSQPVGCVAAGGGNPNLFNCQYQINRRSNGPGGRNQGFEAQISRPLFGGLGVIANYTYSDAKASTGDPIPGNSKHTLNLTGYYETDLVSARMSYNYRSKFFIDIDRAAPLNQASLASLDGSLGINVTDNVTLTADAVNLTNEKIEQYSGTPDRPRAIYDNGRQFYVGARLKF